MGESLAVGVNDCLCFFLCAGESEKRMCDNLDFLDWLSGDESLDLLLDGDNVESAVEGVGRS